MQKARIFFFLGIWLALLPYLGFPSLWKSVLTTLSGLWLIYLGYMLYRESKAKESNVRTFDNFSENESFEEEAK